MFILKKISILLIISLLVSGCASTPNVKLKEQFWQNHKQTVAILESTLPKPQLYQEGAEGMLDVLINSAVTNGFSKYLASYNFKPIIDSKHEFAHRLQEKHIYTEIINEPIDLNKINNYKANDYKRYANKDFRQLNSITDADTALIISVKMLGATRAYYGFIPLGAPKAFCNLEGQLVDLSNNQILWRYKSLISLDISGAWDQPPSYPNFSATINRAVKIAKDGLVQDFFSGT